jgi:catechol 2,3-dioxygenase-like lactoylglutathione lyase family enzyme
MDGDGEATIEIQAVDHIGLRVADGPRSEAFFAKLGFSVIARFNEDSVVILKNAAGVELNLIVNADRSFDGTNALMDEDLPKRAGYTHVALAVGSLEETVERLGVLGIAISGGPVRLGDRMSLFVRDPDRNVIELRQAHASSGAEVLR